jgi:outer membrane biosynthesis protein TonB
VASTLADGNHSFAVRATDIAGNTDASAAASSLTVDTVAPHTVIGSAPLPITIGGGATIVFGSEEGAVFECRLDGGAWTPCESPATFAGLTLGDHTFTVRAADQAGNVEAPGASATWVSVTLPVPPPVPDPTPEPPVVDPTPEPTPDPPVVPAPETPDTTPIPEVELPAPPVPSVPAPVSSAPTLALVRPATGSSFTTKLNAAATAVDRDGVARVEFWLDGTRITTDRTAPYTAGWTATKSVSYGAHTLTVRAFDRKGAASSAAIAISRIRATASTAAKFKARAVAKAAIWHVASLAVEGNATQLEGTSSADDAMTITYTRCGDASGRAVGTHKVRSDADGRVTGTIPARGACVLKVS